MKRMGMLVSAMSPTALPPLMDALATHAQACIDQIEPIYTLTDEMYAYAHGDVDEPSDRVRDFARSAEMPVRELAESFRQNGLVVSGLDYRLTVGIYAAQVLAAHSARSRKAIFCTPGMSALVAAAAGEEIEQIPLTATDLPAPSGIAYLADDAVPLVLRWASTSSGTVTANIVPMPALKRLIVDWDLGMRAQPFEKKRLGSDDPVETFDAVERDVDGTSVRPDRALRTLMAITRLTRNTDVVSREVVRVKTRTVDAKGKRTLVTEKVARLDYPHWDSRTSADPGRHHVVAGRWDQMPVLAGDGHESDVAMVWTTEAIVETLPLVAGVGSASA